MPNQAAYRGLVSYDPQAFGRRLAAARVWAGLSVKEVAESLGVSAETVYQYERGARVKPPDKLKLAALARLLGQSEGWLLGGEQPPWKTRCAVNALLARKTSA